MGVVAVIHNDSMKVLEKGWSGCMEVCNHLIRSPLPQHLDHFIVHSPKEEYNCTDGLYGVVADVFRAETQVGTNFMGDKKEVICDLCAADPGPLGAVLNIGKSRVGFPPKEE